MPKVKSSLITSKRRISAKIFRLSRWQVATLVVVLVGFGSWLIYKSYATSAPFATYYYTSPGIAHTSGFGFSYHERLNGTVQYFPSLRGWYNQPASSYQTSHYLQYGPYATVSIPPSYTGLHVCFYYSTWNDFPGSGGYVLVDTDLHFDDTVDLTPTSVSQPEKVQEYPLDSQWHPTIQSHCYNFPITSIGLSGYMQNVEYRLKVVGSSDGYGRLDLWKTTVSYY